MYLKNTSATASVVLNTIVGKIGLKPGEIINLQHKLLPPISKSVIQVDKEEYLFFRQGTEKVEKPAEQEIPNNTQSAGSVGEQVELEETEEVIENVQTIVEGMSKDVQNQDILDFVKGLLTKPKEEFEKAGEEPKEDPFAVKETKTEQEIKNLEIELEKLRDLWQQTKAPSKKGKIAKQIKELQKQIDKLNKEIERNADE